MVVSRWKHRPTSNWNTFDKKMAIGENFIFFVVWAYTVLGSSLFLEILKPKIEKCLHFLLLGDLSHFRLSSNESTAFPSACINFTPFKIYFSFTVDSFRFAKSGPRFVIFRLCKTEGPCSPILARQPQKDLLLELSGCLNDVLDNQVLSPGRQIEGKHYHHNKCC